MTYQWRKNGQPITDGGAISGATTATLTLNQTSSGDAATYDVVVNGAAPCSSATSGPAVLIVNLPPTITNQPETNQVVCAGMPASFLVDATGTGLTYQWRKDGTNLVDGGHITGATTATLDIGPTSAEDSGSYEVVVTGAGPCTSATSAPAKLVVNLPPAITVQPQTNVTICMPGPASFHVEATGTDLTYRWRKNAQPLVDGGNVSGATTATLTLTATSPQDAATYDVIVSAASPCSTVTSAAGTLQVNKAPTIIVQPDVNQEVCAGTSAIFIVDAAGDGLTYQWRKGGVNIVDSTNIIGATTATLSIEPASESDSGAYDVVISGRAACSNVVSTVANLSVNVPPSITTQPQAPPTACTNASISLSVTAAGTDLIYQWRKDGTNLANDGHISGATNATLTINPASTPDAGSYDVVIKGSAACSKTVTSTPVTVSVSEPITIIEQPRGGKFCFSGVATLSVKATGTGLTYQWLKNGTNLINGGNISGATNATLTIDSPSEADNGNYQVVVTATPCGSITSETAELKGGVCLNYRVIRDQQSQVTDIEFTWTSSA
ncbi:MAG: phage tail protein, partial [Verrucomicrobiota bacterium]